MKFSQDNCTIMIDFWEASGQLKEKKTVLQTTLLDNFEQS